MADTYNVFISWSGDRSKRVAAALHDWLPMVVQTAAPWMSEEDIEKGSRGLDEIGKALEAMGVGIICLTPENLERPWILFEAGALSKALGDRTRVCPYLLGDLRPENVKPPLGMFQATKAVKDDTRKLVETVNRVLRGALGEDKLDTVFERMWPELEKKLKEIPAAKEAAVPQRSERDMLVELLELSRAATANDGWSKDALVTLLRGVEWLNVIADDGRVPLRSLSGIGARSSVPLTKEQLEAGERALAEWERFRSTTGAPAAEKESLSAAAVGRFADAIEAVRKANEQGKEEPHRVHAPALKRAGRQGKTDDEKK